MQIEYFLNQKYIDKIKKERIMTSIFQNSKQKINFSPTLALSDDIVLVNYMKAYQIKKTDLIFEEIYIKNIISLLYIEGEVNNHEYNDVYNLLIRIDKGEKPKTKLEKLIFNIIEINRLVKKEDFKINLDNYELIVHLLFRSTEFNLDRKSNYFRDEANKFHLKIKIDDIDKEINQIFNFLNYSLEDNIDGITKILIIFYSFVLLQPYKNYNLILSFLFTNWFLNQNKIELFNSIDLFKIFENWEEINNNLSEVVSRKMNIDKLLNLTKELIRLSYKKNFLNNLLSIWILENNFSKKIDKSEKFTLLSIINNRAMEVSFEDILKSHKVDGKLAISELEIKSNIAKLKQLKIIKKLPKKDSYTTTVKDLEKFKQILK